MPLDGSSTNSSCAGSRPSPWCRRGAAGAPSWTPPPPCRRLPRATSRPLPGRDLLRRPAAAPRTGRTRPSGRSHRHHRCQRRTQFTSHVTPPRLESRSGPQAPDFSSPRPYRGQTPFWSGQSRLRTGVRARSRTGRACTLPRMTLLPRFALVASGPCSRWRPPPPSPRCHRPTASSGTSRTPRRGRRTAAASPPAAAPIPSTASAT